MSGDGGGANVIEITANDFVAETVTVAEGHTLRTEQATIAILHRADTLEIAGRWEIGPEVDISVGSGVGLKDTGVLAFEITDPATVGSFVGTLFADFALDGTLEVAFAPGGGFTAGDS